ncbi:MAG: hypothetical protein IJ955_10325, partial [Oscillospiraceae bacterium]|nr:hypothetical protein [Oscillospiraceae bacterium]
NMFSGLSWDGDVRTALEDVKSAFSDAYQTISEIVGDIWGAVTKGAEKATTEKEKRNANGGFGDSVNAGAVSGDVYLDGKKVGKILTENTKNSKIAGSPDIEFLM